MNRPQQTPQGPRPALPGNKPRKAPQRSLARRIDDMFSGLSSSQSPIVPRATVVGNSLVFVTAIMCFLACLALGTAWAANRAAQMWTADAAREITVQIKPVDGVETDNQVGRALEVLRGARGITEARALSEQENAAILEPWLGTGLDLGELPVPRMIVVKLDPVVQADLAALSATLAQAVPGAVLDDHRLWQARVRAVTGWIEAGAFLILALMLGATVAIVVFATRGAMAGNRDIVEVLHLVGARQGFIARQFQVHFLVLGLKGGLIGGAAAALAFVLARFAAARFAAPAAGGNDSAVSQALSIGMSGYAGIAGIVAGIAVLAAVTSRITVRRHLRVVD